MKKFFFALETVLSYKEQVLDGLKGEHARILAKVRECERALEALEEERCLCASEFQEHRIKGMTIGEAHAYEGYLDSLRIRIYMKQQQLAKLREQEEAKRSEVVEAKKGASSIEKLREKKLDSYNKAVQKSEELIIEEFVTTARVMAAQGAFA